MSDWTAKIFSVVSVDDNQRQMAVTVRDDDNEWEAQDPKDMIAPDRGYFNEAAGITAFFNQSTKIFIFHNCKPDSVAETASGTGEIVATQEYVNWTCDTVI